MSLEMEGGKCSLDMGEFGSINTGDGSSGMMFVWYSYTY